MIGLTSGWQLISKLKGLKVLINFGLKQIFPAFFDIMNPLNIFIGEKEDDFNYRCEWTAGYRASLSFG